MKKTITIITIVTLVIALAGSLVYSRMEINNLKIENSELRTENSELKEIVDHHEDELNNALWHAYTRMNELVFDGTISDIPDAYHRDYGDDLMGHFWNFNYEIDRLMDYLNIMLSN